MEERVDPFTDLREQLAISPFEQRFPWFGGDLQTLRDTFIKENLPLDRGTTIEIAVPSLPSGAAGKGHLLAFLDLPKEISNTRALVLLLHGLGGSSRRIGLRRMAFCLINAGFGVLRLNLRGADPGRHLAGGTYAAKCNSDLMPVVVRARELCDRLGRQVIGSKGSLPLFGAGISLGGTMLLNACLEKKHDFERDKPVLDGLVCTSSPLDLADCSASIERARNRVYQNWLLKRLIRQTLEDPFGITQLESETLISMSKRRIPKTIRSFDAAITAPRWGYRDVDAYYSEASPLPTLCENPTRIPPTLVLQALDDPWVPAGGTQKLSDSILSKQYSKLQVLLTKNGGHNGFHGIKGCWGDHLVERWLTSLWREKFSAS